MRNVEEGEMDFISKTLQILTDSIFSLSIFATSRMIVHQINYDTLLRIVCCRNSNNKYAFFNVELRKIAL